MGDESKAAKGGSGAAKATTSEPPKSPPAPEPTPAPPTTPPAEPPVDEAPEERVLEEGEYTREQLFENAYGLTGYSRVCLAGALSGSDSDVFTVEHAQRLADEFLKAPVE